MGCEYCTDETSFEVKVSEIETKCKYHKQIGRVFKMEELAPQGLCRELFYAAYPKSLAVLYNGMPNRGKFRTKGINQLVTACPAPNGVRVRIRTEERLHPYLRMIKELFEEFLKWIFRAYDAPFRKVSIEVEEVGSYCPKGYQVGDRFQFNINKQDELCPAAFATVYPYLKFLENEKNVTGKSKSMKVHCPDFVGVTFDVNAK